MGGAIRRHWPTIATVLLLVGVAIGFLATLRPVPPPPDLARDLHAEPPEALRDLQRSIGHWQAAATGERIAYLEWLTDTGLEDVRQQAKAHIRLRARNQQVETAYLINSIFSLFAALSLGLLLVPFFVSKEKVPDRKRLWLHALLSAAILAVTFVLLGGALELFLGVTGTATRMADPQIALTDAAIDRLRLDADRILEAGGDPADDPLPFGPTVGAQAEGYDHGFLTNLLENLRYFDASAFDAAIRWAKRAWHLYGWFPILVPWLVALVFLLTMRQLVVYVVSMPYRAARGETKPIRRAMGRALGFVGREVVAIILLMFVISVVSAFVNRGAHLLSDSAVQLALQETRTTVDYFGRLEGPADEDRLTWATLALPAYVGLTTLGTLLGLGLFAFWARRVTQLRVHRQVPLSAHDGFWRRGFLVVLRLQWIPVLALWLALPMLLTFNEGAPPSADGAMNRLMATTWMLVFVWIVPFVLFGGVRAVKMLVMFRPRRTPPAPDVSLRPATEDDHEFLRRVHHAGLEQSVARTFGHWDEEEQDGFVREWLEDFEGQVILRKDKPIGYVECHEQEDVWFLATIVLLPRAQSRGIGTALVGEMQAQAAESSKPIELQVLSGNPRAKKLYQRLGFVVTKEDEKRTRMRWTPPGS